MADKVQAKLAQSREMRRAHSAAQFTEREINQLLYQYDRLKT
jgi:hypothetical protein